MKAHILCVDDNGSRWIDRRRSLEDVGFVVMNACDETQAAEFLKSHPVDVVCVDSHSLSSVGRALGASIKSVRPQVPLVLICDNDTMPGAFGEHVDIVIEGPDFDTRGQWLLEELHDAYAPSSCGGLPIGRTAHPLPSRTSRLAFAEMGRELVNITNQAKEKHTW